MSLNPKATPKNTGDELEEDEDVGKHENVLMRRKTNKKHPFIGDGEREREVGRNTGCQVFGKKGFFFWRWKQAFCEREGEGGRESKSQNGCSEREE